MRDPGPTSTPAALAAAAELYHTYFTGLILTLVSRRGGRDAAAWVFRVFRHQHQEKFLSSFDKLGLTGMPHALACAAYHYLSNAVGGVAVEFMPESDTKAWVRFVPPRWIYPGAAICGVPSEVSRAMLHGWYAQNGVSLNNPRLGFVCTAQTVDGQHGLAGYFLEYPRDLAPEERLQFRPGELPPPFDHARAPRLPEAQWPPERRAKASRNYAMEYVRSGLPRLAELFGPADAVALGRVTGLLVGAQCYRQTADALGVTSSTAEGFADWLVRLAAAEGDVAETEVRGEAVHVRRRSWRLVRGLAAVSPAVFEAWNGVLEGALSVHNRFLVLEVLRRVDYGDDGLEWRIRPRGPRNTPGTSQR
jgi:hypothetical protein